MKKREKRNQNVFEFIFSRTIWASNAYESVEIWIWKPSERISEWVNGWMKECVSCEMLNGCGILCTWIESACVCLCVFIQKCSSMKAICIQRIWIKNASFVSSIWLVYRSHFHFGTVAKTTLAAAVTVAATVAHWRRRRRHLHSAFDSSIRIWASSNCACMCAYLFMNGSLKCTGASIETFNSIKYDETITSLFYIVFKLFAFVYYS